MSRCGTRAHCSWPSLWLDHGTQVWGFMTRPSGIMAPTNEFVGGTRPGGTTHEKGTAGTTRRGTKLFLTRTVRLKT